MLLSEEKSTAIKGQLLQEANAWTHKPRYGLFSYNAGHGFGFRDEQKLSRGGGRAQSEKKNFMTGRPNTANDKLDAFTKTGYLSFNNEYIEPTKVMKYRDSNSNKALSVHGQAFRPSGSNPKKIKAPYEYISDPMTATQSGAKPRNFMTNPGKKGFGNTTHGHLFSHPSYESDPYDFPKLVDSLERKEHWGKIKDGPFFTTYPKRDHFTPNIQVYRDPAGNNRRPNTSNQTQNFKPFLRSNPPKKGYNCTINPFPQYAEEGEIEPYKTVKSEGVWRYTYNGLSVPSMSVMNYNSQNRPRRKF